MKKFLFLLLFFSLIFFLSLNAAAEASRLPRINFKEITGDDFIGQAGILYSFQNKKRFTMVY